MENEDLDNKVDEKYFFCSQCGEKNLSTNKFCLKCGNNLKDSSNNNTSKEKYNNYDIETFISNNSNYYLTKFQDMKQSQSDISWNWASFFFSGYWLIYRKMYALGIGALISLILISFIPSSLIDFILTMVIWLLCGMFGNSMYLSFIQKELISASYLPPIEKQRRLKERGGTNILAPILILVATIIIAIILVIIGLIHTCYYYGMYF